MSAQTAGRPSRIREANGGIPRRRRGGRPVWQERPSPVAQFGKTTVISLVLLAILGPLYAIVLTSFSTESAVVKAGGGLVVVPDGLTLQAYREILSNGVVTRALMLSFAITGVGTAISMVISILCAYGLSRPNTLGHRKILMFIIITMFFSGGLIPGFLVVSNLGGYDQYWALILPSAVGVFNIIIMRAVYQNTATELMDAARIDGAGDWRILWSIVLPTTKAVTAVMSLFYAVGYWGNWFGVMLYLGNDSTKWPLAYILYQYVDLGAAMPGAAAAAGHTVAAPVAMSMAVVVLTLLPVVLVYPFVQKHFTKGMLTGAIKG